MIAIGKFARAFFVCVEVFIHLDYLRFDNHLIGDFGNVFV